MQSRLLIDEPPLLVLRSLAQAVGLNEAIILQQIHYRQTSERNKNHFDGRVWVRHTYDEWGKEFPFWTKNTIVRTFDKLYEQQLILTYMEQVGFRNQKYYSVDYDMLNEVAGLMVSTAGVKAPLDIHTKQASENSEIDLPKMGRSTYQNEKAPKSSCETYTYKDKREGAAPVVVAGENNSLYKEQPTPVAVSGLGAGQNDQIAGFDSDVQSADYEISGSPTTQDGLLDLPKLGRPSTQNGYAEIPNLGKSYTEEESFLRDINLPPLTPPNSKSAQGENEEEELSQRMIKAWNRLVQGKIKGAPRKKLVLTDSRRQALEALFRGILNHDLAEWERYCQQISETRFLLGENTSGFRVSLEWALSSENALKVLEGRIYDKPGVRESKSELSQGDFNQELEDFFRSKGYPTEWLGVYRGFAARHGQATFNAWLKPCVPLIRNEQAKLVAPTSFHRDYIVSHYQSDILQTLRTINPSVTDFTISKEEKQ